MYTGGKLCEKCSGGRFYNCFLNRCTKGSAFGSLINTVEMYLHYALRYYQNVDRYITVSSFYRDKMIEAGFQPEKVVHIPNFIDASEFQYTGADKGYGLYFGRLSDEKGVGTLLKSLALCPDIPFYLAGSGPQEKELKEFAERTGLRNVTFLGFKKGEDLKKLVQEASFTVIPSEWYENCPMSVIESLAMGTPVIGSRIGGIPELIRDGVDGLTFKAGDPEDLALKMRSLWKAGARRKEMGLKGRAKAEREYSPELFYAKVMKIYEEALRR
jgi:glycosyltransferase involved in cell wall biosynthesis